MKYVVFKYANLFMPVIIPEHVTHSQIKIEDAKPISAGFFHFKSGLLVVSGIGSESLKLKPHARDKSLLESVFAESGTNSFIDWDSIGKPKKREPKVKAEKVDESILPIHKTEEF